ncbi:MULTISPECIES: hypothetical protein [unclassified Rhizobium]|uniref:hypothetical protein n=1 Tax=unclassified Rhizobium TaxID=2613769 RepID=UPI0007EE8873|nr:MULTISPECIES: hypothetical protein [unclassified Rhizobium]
MSIAKFILSPHTSPDARQALQLSSNLFKFPAFLDKESSEELRRRIIFDSKNLPKIDSWASNRKELFNLEYIVTLQPVVKNVLQNLYQKRVEFSYNFTSLYVDDVSLKRHIDRVGCDINFLIFLGEDFLTYKAPIICVRDDERDLTVDGEAGDAVLFLGRTMEHFRPSDPNRTNLITTILHYVF